MKIHVKKTYPDIDSEGYVSLPEYFRQALVSGAIYMLAGTQKYRDESLFAIHRAVYDEQFSAILANENSFGSPDILNYGAVDNTTSHKTREDYCVDIYGGLL